MSPGDGRPWFAYRLRQRKANHGNKASKASASNQFQKRSATQRSCRSVAALACEKQLLYLLKLSRCIHKVTCPCEWSVSGLPYLTWKSRADVTAFSLRPSCLGESNTMTLVAVLGPWSSLLHANQYSLPILCESAQNSAKILRLCSR